MVVAVGDVGRLLPLLLLTACELGPPLPPRALETSCRPFVDGEPVPTLADTGCFVDVEELTPAPDLVPYAVRSPLWTDGARKTRWVVVPVGETLSWRDGELVLPEGTILIKLFELEGVDDAPRNPRRMEVRFLVLDEVWRMFTYRFDPEGRSAALLDDGLEETLTVDGEPIAYQFPDRLTCSACHFSEQPVIGFTPDQLSYRWDYGPATENQLVALTDVGLLEPAAPVATRLVDPESDEATLEERARSWLHSNCAHCHRPGGWGAGTGMDLRIERPLAETRLCGERTDYYGLFGPYRIEPGFPMESGLYRRLTAEGLERMPPVGVSVIDPTGEEVIRRWITRLADCPTE